MYLESTTSNSSGWPSKEQSRRGMALTQIEMELNRQTKAVVWTASLFCGFSEHQNTNQRNFRTITMVDLHPN